MAFTGWIFFSAFTIIIIGFLLSMRILRRKRTVVATHPGIIISGTIPIEGVEVSVLKTYAGLKVLAPITFAQNSLNPELVFFNDHINYKVLRTRRAGYGEIESVRSFTSKYYNKLRFDFTHAGTYFMAVFANEDSLIAVLDFLAAKGIYPEAGN